MAARTNTSSDSPPLTTGVDADALPSSTWDADDSPSLTWDADDEPLKKSRSDGKPTAATKSKSKGKPAAATNDKPKGKSILMRSPSTSSTATKPKSTLMRSQSVSGATKAISIANLVKGKGGKGASAKRLASDATVTFASPDQVRDSEEENDDNDDD